jgi:hypothetical protein
MRQEHFWSESYQNHVEQRFPESPEVVGPNAGICKSIQFLIQVRGRASDFVMISDRSEFGQRITRFGLPMTEVLGMSTRRIGFWKAK